MKGLAKSKAVIIFGPPGGGKGVQAELLVSKYKFTHFDTGDFIRSIFRKKGNSKDPSLKKQKQLYKSGKLLESSWVLAKASKQISSLAKHKKKLVLTGSPRTYYEAFGPKGGGIIQLLAEIYGKENLYIFILELPDKIAVERNISRKKLRDIDTKKTMKIRLREYRKLTIPILKELRKRKYKVIKIDARPLPGKMHKEIVKKLK